MHLDGLYGTCSMVELVNVDYDEIIKLTKDEFLSIVADHDEENNAETQAIIYNTIYSREKIEELKEKFGFEETFSYKGNSNCTVYTLMLKL